MSPRGEKASPCWDQASPARQFLKVGMAAGILSGTSAAPGLDHERNQLLGVKVW